MGRILGLDVGSKTIGVAISDPMGWTAQGLEVLPINAKKDDWGFDQLAKILETYPVEKCVIGLPKNMDGSSGERVEISIDFGNRFEEEFNIPVIYQDERLTTKQAERMLIEEGNVSRKNRKKVIDKLAAILILQSYLDQL